MTPTETLVREAREAAILIRRADGDRDEMNASNLRVKATVLVADLLTRLADHIEAAPTETTAQEFVGDPRKCVGFPTPAPDAAALRERAEKVDRELTDVLSDPDRWTQTHLLKARNLIRDLLAALPSTGTGPDERLIAWISDLALRVAFALDEVPGGSTYFDTSRIESISEALDQIAQIVGVEDFKCQPSIDALKAALSSPEKGER